MDWKTKLGNAAKSAYQKGEEWGSRFYEERERASRMSDAELVRAIKSGGGTYTRKTVLRMEAKERGLIKD